jgi:hypothetical protein
LASGNEAGSGRRLASTGMSVLRTSSSRILGVALLASSASLYLVAYVTGFLPFEIASLLAFVLGVALLAVELEPRTRLRVAADGMLGYIEVLNETLKAMKVSGKATYVPRGGKVVMVMAQEGGGQQVELTPVSAGIYDEIAGEAGEIDLKGVGFFDFWVPKILVDNLSMTDEVKISREGDNVKVSMRRPFVRRLCVNKFVNENVCCRMGCPLAGAVAEALATTTGRDVQFVGCAYDPRSQRAETTLSQAKSG